MAGDPILASTTASNTNSKYHMSVQNMEDFKLLYSALAAIKYLVRFPTSQ